MTNKIHIGIIGGGIAGLAATTNALRNGFRVTLFEQNNLGGKAFNGGDLYLNNFFQEIKLKTDNDREKLMTLFNNYEINKVEILNTYFPFLKNNENFQAINAQAKIISNTNIIANNKKHFFDYILIAAGSKHNIPSISGLEESLKNGYSLFSTKMSHLNENTNKVAIIGAGRVALELAMILIAFKIEVHVFARDDVLNHLDNEVKKVFLSSIKNEFLYFHLNTKFEKITDNTLFYNNKKAVFDHILIASGFNYNKAIIKNLNIKTSEQGIIVNNFMQTSLANVYAIGDINTRPKFSKTAINEALVAINHIKGIRTTSTDDFFYHILGKIEYAYQGLNEEELLENQIEYHKIVIEENQIVNNYDNIKLVKLLVKKTTREILGIFVVAEKAASVMNSILLMLEEKITDVVNNRLTLFTNTHFVVLIINDFLKAIDQNIIDNYYEPFYQIKVDKNNKIIGAESLARFKYNNSFLSPLPLITNFEKSGLILELDLKTIENACILINELETKNLLDADFYISVNLSSLSVDMLKYQKIQQVLKTYNVNPQRILFEITERKTLEDNNYVKKLNKFKSLGFHLSMDDFSVGNSSLNLYHNVNFNEVKLDMDLLPIDEFDEMKISIYESLVKMLRKKEILISAEGIETEFHFNFTKKLNIDNFQGYYFSKPLPIDHFTKLLREKNFK